MIKPDELIFYMGDSTWFSGIFHMTNFTTVYKDNSGALMFSCTSPDDSNHSIEIRLQSGWTPLSDFFSSRVNLFLESQEYYAFSMIFGEQNTKNLRGMYLEMEKCLQE